MSPPSYNVVDKGQDFGGKTCELYILNSTLHFPPSIVWYLSVFPADQVDNLVNILFKYGFKAEHDLGSFGRRCRSPSLASGPR